VQAVDVNRAEDGSAYLVMEHLSGEDLATRMRRDGRMELAVAVGILGQVSSALQAAHEKGIVHRDLKPQNVMLCRQGDGLDVVKVLDFGISKILGAPASLTQSSALMGTPAYMSPEQASERSSESDARTDVFAMGAILYHALSGEPPFTGASVIAVLYKIVHDDPPPLGALRPDLPRAVVEVVERALRKRPEERFASARAFREALCAAAGLSPQGEGAGERPPPFQRADPAEPPTAPPQLTGDRALASTLGASVGQLLGTSRRPRRSPWLPVAAAALLASGVVTVLVIGTRHPAEVGKPVVAAAPPDGGRPSGLAPDQHVTAAAPSPRTAERDAAAARPKPRTALPRPERRQAATGSGRLRVGVQDENRELVKARIFLDGQFLDESPIGVRTLPAGVHTIRVVAEGYLTESKRIKVVPDRESHVLFTMKASGGSR
jgi:serine/threonine-protein kinase